MLAQPEIQKIRDALGYEGLSGPGILEALTAAGADNNNLDGNKRLAQMGTSLIEYQVIEMGYRTMMSRGIISSNLKDKPLMSISQDNAHSIHFGNSGLSSTGSQTPRH